jgi:hypothetical protein
MPFRKSVGLHVIHICQKKAFRNQNTSFFKPVLPSEDRFSYILVRGFFLDLRRFIREDAPFNGIYKLIYEVIIVAEYRSVIEGSKFCLVHVRLVRIYCMSQNEFTNLIIRISATLRTLCCHKFWLHRALIKVAVNFSDLFHLTLSVVFPPVLNTGQHLSIFLGVIGKGCSYALYIMIDLIVSFDIIRTQSFDHFGHLRNTVLQL